MTAWNDEDVDALDLILIRAKSQALSEKNDAGRMWVAYSDRPVFGSRFHEAIAIIQKVERLQVLAQGLRYKTLKN